MSARIMGRMRSVIWVMGVLLASAAAGPVAAAPSPCESFKWDVSREHALFMGAATALAAGRSTAYAPVIVPDRLYELTLVPQKDTTFSIDPHRRESVEDASAGLVYLTVTGPGLYRISADASVWLDLIDSSGAARAVDYQGQQGCSAPHKVVEFEIISNKVLIQVSGSSAATVQLTVTRDPGNRPTT